MEASSPAFLSRLRQPWTLDRTRSLLLDAPHPTWPDAHLVVVDIPVAKSTVDQWLPSPLKTPAVPTATIFVADYPTTSFGVAYRECGVLLHATLRGRPVVHCAWMVVDDDTALILGRELLGFPKKLAEIELHAGDGLVQARVARHGVELLAIHGRLGGPIASAKAFDLPIANVRGIPSVGPAVLWRMEVPERFHEGAEASLEINIASSDRDPLASLSTGGMLAGRWLRVDLGVPPRSAPLIPSGIVPVGLVSPLWLARMYPMRTM